MSITPEHPAALSRRTVLRRAAAVGVLATPAIGLLSACATSGGDERRQRAGRAGTKSAKNPLGVKEDAALEVIIFNGGYGEKYATDVHEPLYKKAFPKAEIKHQATQAVSTVLQPRFACGNPPEFVNNSGEKLIDFGALVADGQLQDLTELWDAPSVDDPSKKVRDTVVPRHRRRRARSTASRTSCTTSPPSSASGTPASSSRTTAGRRRRPGTSSSPCSTRSRPRASPRTATPGRTRPTTSGT